MAMAKTRESGHTRFCCEPVRQPPRVAFQGEHGAFSEDAALKLLGTEIQLVPRRTFEMLFESLDEDLADYLSCRLKTV